MKFSLGLRRAGLLCLVFHQLNFQLWFFGFLNPILIIYVNFFFIVNIFLVPKSGMFTEFANFSIDEAFDVLGELRNTLKLEK